MINDTMKHLIINQRRLTSQKFPKPDGKNSATVRADSTNIFRPPVSLNIASPMPEYSRSGPSVISVSASGISNGTTPIVPGMQVYDEIPNPKVVVAVGICPISGGVFRDSYAIKSQLDAYIPVDVNVPGCPPRPQAIIDGIAMAIEIWKSKF